MLHRGENSHSADAVLAGLAGGWRLAGRPEVEALAHVAWHHDLSNNTGCSKTMRVQNSNVTVALWVAMNCEALLWAHACECMN